MSELHYTKHELVSLKGNAQFTEKWLQQRIVENPTILGLGDVEVKDVEKVQPKAGRLDLLLRDPDTGRRYEVEIMLGTIDESHIIRTIEYWDIERRRYPQYDHCAVIVAETINSRFLNVVGLFNGFIPLIALQMSALKVGNQMILHFTKVLDEMPLGLADDVDTTGGQDQNRAYWETKGSKTSVALADECLAIIREFAPTISLKYKKNYIGLADAGVANNFAVFVAKKEWIRAGAKLVDQTAWRSWKSRLDEVGMTVLGEKTNEWLRFRIAREDIQSHRSLLKELFEAAYREQLH